MKQQQEAVGSGDLIIFRIIYIINIFLKTEVGKQRHETAAGGSMGLKNFRTTYIISTLDLIFVRVMYTKKISLQRTMQLSP
jgi:hypothetical protein